jgi:hypothetical protein
VLLVHGICSAEHNLPDSPFASPTKSASVERDGFASARMENVASRVGVECGSNADGGIIMVST